QTGKGLVHEDEMLAAQELLGDGDTLALAAGQLAGVEIAAVLQAEPVEEGQGLFDSVLAAQAGTSRRQLQVSQYSAVLEQRVVLRDNADHAALDGLGIGADC